MDNTSENIYKNEGAKQRIPEWLASTSGKAGIPRQASTDVDVVDTAASLLDIEEKIHIPTHEVPPASPETPKAAVERVVIVENADQAELLSRKKTDRRLLPHVPPRRAVRTNSDQRGREESAQKRKKNVVNPALPQHFGMRYEADIPVTAQCVSVSGATQTFQCQCKDISTNGMQLHVRNDQDQHWIRTAKKINLRFEIEPGIMPEGYEMHVKMAATLVTERRDEKGRYVCGVKFAKSLVDYAYKRRGRNLRSFALVMLVLTSILIVGMRLSSLSMLYTNRWVYIYSLVTAAYLLTRYLFGALYKPTPVNPDFTPGVSILIPCYNEEEWIERTILSCLDQDYPIDKLEVIIVDDFSRDHSHQRIEETLQKLAEIDDLYDTVSRVSYVRQNENLGKREAIARGARIAKHELLVFVDSDSFLDPYAIQNLVQPFQDPKVGGACGRTDVANAYTNLWTKMQSVRYYISFRIMKAVEGHFNAVTCLSGPLACYRKSLVEENMDAWVNQRFLGQKATLGDDRSLTNFILRTHRTDYQDTAICSTIVPRTQRQFLRQQMRWKRSWLRESTIAAGFMWKKEPFMAISFYVGYIIPVLAPFIVLYNLVYMPIFVGIFPTTFIVGLFAMSLLMSMTQMLLRRSKLWVYGIFFQLYYVFVLLWQMPIAWVTFWKSTWGTRMTTNDLRAQRRRRRRSGSRTRPTGVEEAT